MILLTSRILKKKNMEQNLQLQRTDGGYQRGRDLWGGGNRRRGQLHCDGW